MYTYTWIWVNLPEIWGLYKSVVKVVKVQDNGHSPTSGDPTIIYKDVRIVQFGRFGRCRCDLEELGCQPRNETSLRTVAVEHNMMVPRVFLGYCYSIETQRSTIQEDFSVVIWNSRRRWWGTWVKICEPLSEEGNHKYIPKHILESICPKYEATTSRSQRQQRSRITRTFRRQRTPWSRIGMLKWCYIGDLGAATLIWRSWDTILEMRLPRQGWQSNEVWQSPECWCNTNIAFVNRNQRSEMIPAWSFRNSRRCRWEIRRRECESSNKPCDHKHIRTYVFKSIYPKYESTISRSRRWQRCKMMGTVQRSKATWLRIRMLG